MSGKCCITLRYIANPDLEAADIRVRSMVRNANGGSLMIIPRENKLVRLYIQLTDGLSNNGRLTRSMVTPEMLIETARRILIPYTIDFTFIHWWSAYQIGQRLGDHFDKQGRIFLAGGTSIQLWPPSPSIRVL